MADYAKMDFRGGLVPHPKPEYVCWLDIMGTQTTMGRSIAQSTNYICKLHIAVLEALKKPIIVYPLLDGIYITCPEQTELLEFLRAVFHRLAENFLAETRQMHRFLVKAAISYGPIMHGRELIAATEAAIEGYTEHWNSLVFGIPVIQSFQAERLAPPFGVYVHESARSFCPPGVNPLPFSWWHWFKFSEKEFLDDLRRVLKEHFDWCSEHSRTINYPRDRISEHAIMAEEFFKPA